MALISVQNISMAFGGPKILDSCTLNIEEGEFICLLGRNGVGKSTFFKIVNEEINPDSGEVIKRKDLETTCLSQKVPENIKGTVFDVVIEGLKVKKELLTQYHKLNEEISINCTEKLLNKLQEFQHKMEVDNVWQIQTEVETVLTKLKLNPNEIYEKMSGGLKRRVMLAKALVLKPDVLMLDEPTNHLDLESILWLEDFLKNNIKTLMFVTHDREFLKNLANRIIELDRGKLTSWKCNYTQYLERKEEMLKVEYVENAKFDKKLSDEEIWLRKGIRARRTRNEGRVRALIEMRNERANRREVSGKVNMSANMADKSGKLVIEAENINFAFGKLKIVENFNLIVQRKDRIGIIGPNGSGKTTLIKLLLKNLKPNSGKVKLGVNLQIIYFDQLRNQLNLGKTLSENIDNGASIIEVNNHKYHIISYLKNFLFLPEDTNKKVSALSGGERNRLLLAKLFATPSNIMVLDEPTNDLDIETLELLEELLLDYEGTVLLVSHDRKFLNNIVTKTISMETNGKTSLYYGNFENLKTIENKTDKTKEKNATLKVKTKNKSKLTYSEKKELEQLPKNIEQIEERNNQIVDKLSNPQLFIKTPELGKKLQAEMKKLEEQLTKLYERWEELEDKEKTK